MTTQKEHTEITRNETRELIAHKLTPRSIRESFIPEISDPHPHVKEETIKDSLWKLIKSLETESNSQDFVKSFTQSLLEQMNNCGKKKSAPEVLHQFLTTQFELMFAHASQLSLKQQYESSIQLFHLCLYVRPENKLVQQNITLLDG